LEERGREERRAWEILRGEMEDRIGRLVSDAKERERERDRLKLQQEQRQQQKVNLDVDNSSNGIPVSTKPDFRIQERSSVPPEEGRTSPTPSEVWHALVVPGTTYTDVVTNLRNEIQSLRKRCAEFEQTLLAVRTESLELEAVAAALEKARRRIRERVDSSSININTNIDGVDASIQNELPTQDPTTPEIPHSSPCPVPQKQEEETIEVTVTPDPSANE